MPSTAIELVFRVRGVRVDPEQVSELTGIKPARSHHVGDVRGSIAASTAGWEWRSPEGNDVEALVETLMSELGPHVDIFRACNEQGAAIWLTVVGVMRGDLVETWEEAERRKILAEEGDRFRRFFDADRVGIHLSDAAIRFLATVGASFSTHIDIELDEPMT